MLCRGLCTAFASCCCEALFGVEAHVRWDLHYVCTIKDWN